MILDHTESLGIADDELDLHYDARMALARLGEGLFWLYREVHRLELKCRQQAPQDRLAIDIVGGVLEDMPIGLLSCVFQWYAVSACNYAQLVGWLAYRDAHTAKTYMNRILPRLSLYRNKVAAHFAMADPRRDNEADLAASVMTQVIYVNGRLCAAALTPVLKGSETEIRASNDLSWSLTLAHERLIPRFWPSGPTKSSQALLVPPASKVTLSISWSDLFGDTA